jgi:glycosyltransferase involved in cell wall biosynthesis
MNINNKKVSIIVPFYNCEQTFRACLNSLNNQSYDNYEIIIVNNNSNDGSLDIAKDFIKKNPKIILLTEMKKGRGAARRSGEIISSGEIILMTDSDCILPPDWVKEMTWPIINLETEAVQGSEDSIDTSFWSMNIQKESERKNKDITLLSSLNILGMIDTKNFAIRRDILEKIGFSSNNYTRGNDNDLSIKLSKTNFSVLFNKKSIVSHNHPNSFKKTSQKYFQSGYWVAKITKDNLDYLARTNFPKNTNQTFYSFFIFFPGLINTLIKDGYKRAYFDLVTGLAWRIGIISYYLSYSLLGK